MSLRSKLLLMWMALISASLLAVLLMMQHWQGSIERQQVADARLALAKRSEFLAQRVGDARQTLRLLAFPGELASARLESIRAHLRAWNASSSQFENFYFISLDGNIHPADGPAVSISDRAYFTLVRQGQAVPGEPLVGRFTGQPVLLMAEPLRDRDGRLAGALAATLRLEDFLSTTVYDAPGVKPALMILDAQRRVLAGGIGETIPVLLALDPVVAPISAGIASGLEARSGNTALEIETIPVKRNGFRIFSASIPELGWLMVYAQPEAAFLESFSFVRRLAWGIMLGLIMLATVALFLVQRLILTPVQALRDAQAKVQAGDLSARTTVRGSDEFAGLAESFNHMVASLEAAERRFRVVFEAFPHPIALNSFSDSRYIDVNPAFCAQFGRERSEIVGRTVQELGVVVDREASQLQKAELLAKGRLDSVTVQTNSASEEPHWVIFSSRLVELDGEQVALSVTTDITELKAAEAALKESEASFITLFQLAPVPMAYADVRDDFSCTHWNDAWYQAFGYSREEAENRRGKDIGLWASVEERIRYLDGALAEGAVDGLEAQLRRKDGTLRQCLLHGRLATTGGCQLLLTAYLDVTEIRQAEKELRASETKLQALFNASPSAMVVSDVARGYAVVTANAAWLRQFQRELRNTVGLNGLQFGLWASPADRQRVHEQIEADGVVSGFETQFIRSDGQRLYCRVAAQRFAAGSEDLIVMVQEDVSEQRQAELAMRDLNQRLARQNRLAEAISRAQSEFIANSDIRQVFDALLHDLLELTGSEYGFIGEVLFKADGAPYMKAYALTNISWDDATRRFYDDNAAAGLELHNLKSLFGAVMTSGEPVIANSPASDPRSGGLPAGHPPMHAFLGLPIHVGERLVALAGVANRKGGYDQPLVDWLHPLITTAGQMVEARRVENARHDAEVSVQRFSSMVNHANDAMLLMDGPVVLECNPAALRIFGCTREQLIGQMPAEFSPAQQPDGSDSRKLGERFLEQVQLGEDVRFEWRHRKVDGTEFTAEVALSSFDESSGKRVISVVRDITERKRIEAEIIALNASLEERVASRTLELAERNKELAGTLSTLETAQARLAASEERLSSVVTATGEGIWDLNMATGRVYNSPRWCEILGFSPYDNDHTLDFLNSRLPDEDRDSIMLAVQYCLDGKVPFRLEHRMLRRDGTIIWVQARGNVTERDADGQPLRMVGSIADITDRKRAELALAEAKAKADAANVELAATLDYLRRTQDELLRSEKLASLGALVAGVAHELNTPIGNAVTVASTLVDEQKMFARKIEGGLSRSALTAFVETVGEAGLILDRNLHRAAELLGGFKQLAVDQSSYKRRPFDLQDVVHEILLAMGPAVRKTQHRVIDDVPPGLRLDSYPGPLGQVLMNLINNALIHAFEGKESGSIRIQAESIEPDWFAITVSDDGRGISPEHQKRIFDPFFTTRLGQGGSGLGLHIVFSLVTELLGGRIEVTSALGEGALFRIRMPGIAPPPKVLAVAQPDG